VPHDDITPECWLPVIGYEGVYEVSDFGRVRSARSGHGSFVGRILKSHPNPRGYPDIVLRKDGSVHHFRIHQLVASAFLTPEDGKYEINHIDGNKANNSVANLEYTTRSGNVAHAYRNGLRKSQKGEGNYAAKLTAKQVVEIRSMLGMVGKRKIAAIYNVSRTAIRSIEIGRRWGGIP
jgi:hypothetical protein